MKKVVIVIVVILMCGCISQPPESPESSAESVQDLEGLPLDEFFEESYKVLLLRNPELLTELGIAEDYGLRNDRLNNISDSYIRETHELQKSILELLMTYDRNALTPEQKISYDVYEWFLDDLVRQQEFMYYDYPVTHLLDGYHNSLYHFFTEIHPVDSKQNAEDYISRLSQVDTQTEQLLEGLKLREKAGIVPPRYMVEQALGGVRQMASGTAYFHPLYRTFEEKVRALDLTSEEKEALLKACEQAIDESVLPPLQKLGDYLEYLYLDSAAPSDIGAWQYTKGDEYYAYVLRYYTTTELTPDEIHETGLQEIERIHAEMRQIFDELGYPEDESISELYARVARDGGYVSGDMVLRTYETLIEDAEQNLDEAFDLLPRAEVVVIGGFVGGFYVPASLDGSRPGAFYADVSGARLPRYGMPSLVYHETVPGHHLQIAIAQELDLPLFRNLVDFTGYVEGWALYAEQLAWELGWYDSDPYGNLGRLQYEALRAARLVADTGINAKHWTYDEALTYMRENVGFDPSVLNLRYEVDRYIGWPGHATAYKIGMMKILELRRKAMDELGDQFDLKEFHRVILGNGAVPLEILEKIVQDYIDAKKGTDASYSVTVQNPPSVFASSSDDTVLYGDIEAAAEKDTSWSCPAAETGYDTSQTPVPQPETPSLFPLVGAISIITIILVTVTLIHRKRGKK